MFKVIEDYEQLDKLWEAGLLWVRSDSDEPWLVDRTFDNDDRRRYAPSNDHIRYPENTYEYAILLEE